jgi:hypothetical protein
VWKSGIKKTFVDHGVVVVVFFSKTPCLMGVTGWLRLSVSGACI